MLVSGPSEHEADFLQEFSVCGDQVGENCDEAGLKAHGEQGACQNRATARGPRHGPWRDKSGISIRAQSRRRTTARRLSRKSALADK